MSDREKPFHEEASEDVRQEGLEKGLKEKQEQIERTALAKALKLWEEGAPFVYRYINLEELPLLFSDDFYREHKYLEVQTRDRPYSSKIANSPSRMQIRIARETDMDLGTENYVEKVREFSKLLAECLLNARKDNDSADARKIGLTTFRKRVMNKLYIWSESTGLLEMLKKEIEKKEDYIEMVKKGESGIRVRRSDEEEWQPKKDDPLVEYTIKILKEEYAVLKNFFDDENYIFIEGNARKVINALGRIWSLNGKGYSTPSSGHFPYNAVVFFDHTFVDKKDAWTHGEQWGLVRDEKAKEYDPRKHVLGIMPLDPRNSTVRRMIQSKTDEAVSRDPELAIPIFDTTIEKLIWPNLNLEAALASLPSDEARKVLRGKIHDAIKAGKASSELRKTLTQETGQGHTE